FCARTRYTYVAPPATVSVNAFVETADATSTKSASPGPCRSTRYPAAPLTASHVSDTCPPAGVACSVVGAPGSDTLDVGTVIGCTAEYGDKPDEFCARTRYWY